MYFVSQMDLKMRLNKLTINVRRCGKCLENAKFAEKVKFPEIMYPTQTDTHEESGMQIFRLLESTIMVLLEKQRFAHSV